MVVPKKNLEKLQQEILSAFDSVPYPHNSIAPHECEECREVRKTFSKRDWKTIETQFIEDNFGVIPLFSPEAFHYFLPAYLIRSLENFSEKYDTVCEFTIYAVTPQNKDVENHFDYWQERFKSFTSKQISCVYDFLDLIGQDENLNRFANRVQRGKQNLQKLLS